MSSETAISVNNVSKVYELGLTGRKKSIPEIVKSRARHPLRSGREPKEQFNALDDISFDVKEGEVVGVIGKNGAGKSTLLKILSRITPPSTGHIDMKGSVGSLLEVGTGFHPELTGIENMYLNGAILGMSRAEIDRRRDEIIDFAEVHRFLDTPVKRYSSGMRVRLAFAVAAHLASDILIVDEVLSVGDQSFQAKCLDKMRSIVSEQGRTILYVSHNLVTVEHLCPRSLLLVGGKLAYDGETESTVERYLQMFPRGVRSDIPGVYDLTLSDRSVDPSMQQVFTALEVRPDGGEPSDVVRMGQPLRVEVHTEGLAEIEGAMVQVTVGSAMSSCVFRMSSRMRPLPAPGARSEAETVVIEIPDVPLTPGDYFMSLVLRNKDHEVVDEVYRAADFRVVSTDVFGSGYQFSSGDGDFIVPWEWEVRSSELARERPALSD